MSTKEEFELTNTLSKGMVSFITMSHNTLGQLCKDGTPLTPEILEQLQKEWVSNAYILAATLKKSPEDLEEFLKEEADLFCRDYPDATYPPSWMVNRSKQSDKTARAIAEMKLIAEERKAESPESFSKLLKDAPVKKNEPELICELEKDLKKLKDIFDTDYCFFEKYGRRPALEFDFGFFQFRNSLATIKRLLKTAPETTTIFDVITDGKSKEELIALSFAEKLPPAYRDQYNYNFFCRLEDEFNGFVARVFTTPGKYTASGLSEDETFRRYETSSVAEEIIVYMIFALYATELEDALNDMYHYEWCYEDYSFDEDELIEKYSDGPEDWFMGLYDVNIWDTATILYDDYGIWDGKIEEMPDEAEKEMLEFFMSSERSPEEFMLTLMNHSFNEQFDWFSSTKDWRNNKTKA